MVVSRLVDGGLVTRARSRSDRRRVELNLTAAGMAAARRAPRLAQERLIAAVDRLPPLARRGLAMGLSQLVGHLGLGEQPPPMFFEEGARRAE